MRIVLHTVMMLEILCVATENMSYVLLCGWIYIFFIIVLANTQQ